jgi:hypothetical protein
MYAKHPASERASYTGLPKASPETGDLSRNLAFRGKNERERKLCSSVGRRIGMHVRADQHAVLSAGVDVNMRIDASLADQSQPGQPLHQLPCDSSALPEENERLRIGQALNQISDLLDMIVPYDDFVSCETSEARQASQSVEPVVKDRDFHADE